MEEKQVLPPASGISPPYFGIALVIAVLSFAVGLALGFFARPMVLGDKVEVVEVLITATPNPAAQAVAKANLPTASPVADSGSNENDNAAGAPTAESNDSKADEKADSDDSDPPSIMDMVLADARHFQGEADAPVTIIEFSDFK